MKSIHSRRNSVAVFATALVALASSATLFAAVPEVTEVTMSQDDRRLVTISYTLAYASAVVTVDIQTNANGSTWASIGGENIQQVTGDVWKRIEPGARTIMWRPDLSWPDHKVADGGARAVVTAWALDNTPDYMVVDISSAAEKNSQRYYPAAEFIPGGILGNPDYRTTSLVMRKIMAKDIQWTMGSVAEGGRNASREATHKVTLANNFYIGVFEVTQSQWELITRYNPSYFSTESAMRPVENVCYADIRQGEGTTGGSAAISGAPTLKIHTKGLSSAFCANVPALKTSTSRLMRSGSSRPAQAMAKGTGATVRRFRYQAQETHPLIGWGGTSTIRPLTRRPNPNRPSHRPKEALPLQGRTGRTTGVSMMYTAMCGSCASTGLRMTLHR